MSTQVTRREGLRPGLAEAAHNDDRARENAEEC